LQMAITYGPLPVSYSYDDHWRYQCTHTSPSKRL
jgi:hypothetical protein